MRPRLSFSFPELALDGNLSPLLDRCSSPLFLRPLRRLHCLLLASALLHDPSLQVKLIRAYCACSDPFAARQVFDQSPHRNVVFFNVLLRGLVGHGRYLAAFRLFSSMAAHGVKPDHYTYPCVLAACSESKHLPGGAQIHAAISKLGLDSNLFVSNTLITMYARCRRLPAAELVFSAMPFKDAISFNSLIAGHAQAGDPARALQLCKSMAQTPAARPNDATLASVLSAVSSDVVFLRQLFDEMPERGLISYNAMIAAYANNSMAAEAVALYMEMEREVEPDEITFVSLLPACGDLSALDLGRRIHDEVERRSFRPNLFLENALVDMYAKCGDLPSARRVFEGMENRDVASWTAMISGYGMHGEGREAIAMFESMIMAGVRPDNIAFVAVLSACSHAGLVQEGKLYFSAMADRFRLSPTVEHLTCMVDLLGRAGKVDEGHELVKKMAVQPDERIWGALLSACRLHGNLTVGMEAADNVFKLAPAQSGYYVLASNMYARAGRWSGVAAVRAAMRQRGVKKSPGCSNVEIGGRVHMFLMGDREHDKAKEIYAELAVMAGRMKEAGYAVETEAALHDVEEEDKEGHLAVHSEKLAMAFALISTPPGTTIRVTKNLRVCVDCHTAAKFISKLTMREIILRDIHRFHRFKDGSCSCRDYW